MVFYTLLREECRLRVFENMFLRRIFGPKRDENVELHSLFRSLDIVRVITYRRLGWAGHLVRMEEDRRVFKILTGRPTGKRSLGRPRRRQRLFENRILSRIFGSKKDVNGGGEGSTMRNFIVCTVHLI